MRRSLMLYTTLALAWLALLAWQALEHQRVREAAKRGLADRANDISASLSVLVRSQGRVAMVPRARLESALSDLVASTDLVSVTLLNAAGETAATAGQPMAVDKNTLLRMREVWGRDEASFANLVALGPGTDMPILLSVEGGAQEGRGGMEPPDHRQPRGRQGEEDRPPPPEEFDRGPSRPPRDPVQFFMTAAPEEYARSPFSNSPVTEPKRQALLGMMDGKPLRPEQVDSILAFFPPELIGSHRVETLRRTLANRPLDRNLLDEILVMTMPPHGPPPDQPPWMNRKEYEGLIQERGVHWFLLSIPTKALHMEVDADFRLRGVVALVALLACMALSLAWRSFHRSADLRVQLVRSQEHSLRLEELNLTAAGLVHETKNPLNLIRGLAQMMGRGPDLPEALRGTALKITEEADRITGRLNQFLDYARPPQPHPKLLSLTELVRSIFEVLACDREEKSVTFKFDGPSLTVVADENMMRQVIFNLIHNAIQAVADGGTIEVRIVRDRRVTAHLDVCDNGPGVPEKIREDIFRPYFTASEKGTGLGLAIVRQLASVHGWEVTCVPCDAGAVFRVQGIELAAGYAEEVERA